MRVFCIRLAVVLVCSAILPYSARGAEAQTRGEPAAGEWPTYMHDNERSGVSPAAVELPLNLQWVYRARRAPQPAWPPPAKADLFHRRFNIKPRVTYDRAFHVVGAAGRIYFASSGDDKVYCLDGATGREKWSFFTEGPVRLAPTIAGGKVLFGSDDGCVYCLEAADGSLLWKLRPAPHDRRIPGNGRVISAWPVRTGVLVDGGRGHCCAGLFAGDGVYYGVVDVAAGRKLSAGKIMASPQGYLQLRGAKLFAPTGRDNKGAWLAEFGEKPQPPPTRKPRADAKYPCAAIAAGDLDFCGGEGEVAAFSSESGERLWSEKVEGGAYSLALIGGRLFGRPPLLGASSRLKRSRSVTPATRSARDTPRPQRASSARQDAERVTASWSTATAGTWPMSSPSAASSRSSVSSAMTRRSLPRGKPSTRPAFIRAWSFTRARPRSCPTPTTCSTSSSMTPWRRAGLSPVRARRRYVWPHLAAGLPSSRSPGGTSSSAVR
ncbi:MAG: outer membrane protein assembly factor BamB family protein [Planctomycetota bacterium]